ncbi:hypothetical protein BaRGS_00027266, partial [Batillaria attramentaria]
MKYATSKLINYAKLALDGGERWAVLTTGRSVSPHGQVSRTLLYTTAGSGTCKEHGRAILHAVEVTGGHPYWGVVFCLPVSSGCGVLWV